MKMIRRTTMLNEIRVINYMKFYNNPNDEQKRPECPRCGTNHTVIPIIHGIPSYELFKESETGKFHLGGCCIGDNDTGWYCKDCEHEFGDLNVEG